MTVKLHSTIQLTKLRIVARSSTVVVVITSTCAIIALYLVAVNRSSALQLLTNLGLVRKERNKNFYICK